MHPSLGFAIQGATTMVQSLFLRHMAAEMLGVSERQLRKAAADGLAAASKSTADKIDAGTISIKAERKEEW